MGFEFTVASSSDIVVTHLCSFYEDDSVGKMKIVEMESGKGRTFQREEGSSVGEFYLIDKQGNLQLWDEEGIIWTAKKLD